jgi:hypothetical protein
MAQSENSSWSAARLRNEAENAVMSAVNKCPNGNRTMSDNSQLINLIGIYKNNSLPEMLRSYIAVAMHLKETDNCPVIRVTAGNGG